MGRSTSLGHAPRKPAFTIVVAALMVMLFAWASTALPLLAQSSPTQSSPSPATDTKVPPTPSSSKMPDWQIAAGGKLEFDVASIKPDSTPMGPNTVKSNIPLGPQDMFSPTGGLLSSTNWPLLQYMVFAYKLRLDQLQSIRSQFPKWANTDRYDIQARASGNPTKDQFRLMMQSLLADRFKLAIHYETKQLPVFALVLDKPGKLGPQFREHRNDVPCNTAPQPPGTAPTAIPTIAGGFPEICGVFAGWPSSKSGRVIVGGRNMPMTMLASSIAIPEFTGIDRPVLDKTGLTTAVDFFMEFTPQINGPIPPGATFQPDESGPTFLQALKEQLGLKLDSQTGPVDVVVIDHVEQPSEN